MLWSLNSEVRFFLETECLDEEVEAFFAAVEMVLLDPIGQSRPWLGRSNRPYIVRFFRFGGCLAFFEYHSTGDERTESIRIQSCKRLKPIRGE